MAQETNSTNSTNAVSAVDDINSANSVKLCALSIAHHDCDANTIGKYSLTGALLNEAREIALAQRGVEEVFILSTCNRVEIFVVGNADELKIACKQALSLDGKRDISELENRTKTFENLEAIHHLFEVACGLDSQMIGETEILGQIKKAYASAAEIKHCKKVLNMALQKAIHCAKWIRTNTNIGSGNITIGSVAAELAARIFEEISETKILLAGSGEVGRSVAQALNARGATNITVSSRTWENARALSSDVMGSAIDFNRVASELCKFDIAIFALSNAENIIDYKTALAAEIKRENSPLFLMDLAVPNNVSKECDKLEGIFLYDLADLSKVANENLDLRKSEIEKVKSEIDSRAKSVWQKINA